MSLTVQARSTRFDCFAPVHFTTILPFMGCSGRLFGSSMACANFATCAADAVVEAFITKA